LDDEELARLEELQSNPNEANDEIKDEVHSLRSK
jgi:hypothetical protein